MAEAGISLQITKGRKTLRFDFSQDAILLDLVNACEESEELATGTGQEYDWDKAKFIAKGKILKASEHGEQPIAHLDGTKVTLQVPSFQDVQNLLAASESWRAREARRHAQRAAAVPARRTRITGLGSSGSTATYTFLRIEPLYNLPNPERSREFLVKLSEDPGIKAAMLKHKFTVGFLTEMDPMSNTQSNHEGTTRLLGLNRNKGEVIELRLRTDAYDGYRDYKTIRNTLCHELAHNVHGPHDRKFWDLCHQIEREVQAADWKHGGRSVSSEDFYEPSPEDDVPDHGGWTGGTYQLGGGNGSVDGLSRRDIMAKAIEERLKKDRQSDNPPDAGGEGSSRNVP